MFGLGKNALAICFTATRKTEGKTGAVPRPSPAAVSQTTSLKTLTQAEAVHGGHGGSKSVEGEKYPQHPAAFQKETTCKMYPLFKRLTPPPHPQNNGSKLRLYSLQSINFPLGKLSPPKGDSGVQHIHYCGGCFREAAAPTAWPWLCAPASY